MDKQELQQLLQGSRLVLGTSQIDDKASSFTNLPRLVIELGENGEGRSEDIAQAIESASIYAYGVVLEDKLAITSSHYTNNPTVETARESVDLIVESLREYGIEIPDVEQLKTRYENAHRLYERAQESIGLLSTLRFKEDIGVNNQSGTPLLKAEFGEPISNSDFEVMHAALSTYSIYMTRNEQTGNVTIELKEGILGTSEITEETVDRAIEILRQYSVNTYTPEFRTAIESYKTAIGVEEQAPGTQQGEPAMADDRTLEQIFQNIQFRDAVVGTTRNVVGQALLSVIVEPSLNEAEEKLLADELARAGFVGELLSDSKGMAVRPLNDVDASGNIDAMIEAFERMGISTERNDFVQARTSYEQKYQELSGQRRDTFPPQPPEPQAPQPPEPQARTVEDIMAGMQFTGNIHENPNEGPGILIKSATALSEEEVTAVGNALRGHGINIAISNDRTNIAIYPGMAENVGQNINQINTALEALGMRLPPVRGMNQAYDNAFAKYEAAYETFAQAQQQGQQQQPEPQAPEGNKDLMDMFRQVMQMMQQQSQPAPQPQQSGGGQQQPAEGQYQGTKGHLKPRSHVETRDASAEFGTGKKAWLGLGKEKTQTRTLTSIEHTLEVSFNSSGDATAALAELKRADAKAFRSAEVYGTDIYIGIGADNKTDVINTLFEKGFVDNPAEQQRELNTSLGRDLPKAKALDLSFTTIGGEPGKATLEFVAPDRMSEQFLEDLDKTKRFLAKMARVPESAISVDMDATTPTLIFDGVEPQKLESAMNVAKSLTKKVRTESKDVAVEDIRKLSKDIDARKFMGLFTFGEDKELYKDKREAEKLLKNWDKQAGRIENAEGRFKASVIAAPVLGLLAAGAFISVGSVPAIVIGVMAAGTGFGAVFNKFAESQARMEQENLGTKAESWMDRVGEDIRARNDAKDLLR